jgi:hypothetical protein
MLINHNTVFVLLLATDFPKKLLLHLIWTTQPILPINLFKIVFKNINWDSTSSLKKFQWKSIEVIYYRPFYLIISNQRCQLSILQFSISLKMEILWLIIFTELVNKARFFLKNWVRWNSNIKKWFSKLKRRTRKFRKPLQPIVIKQWKGLRLT